MSSVSETKYYSSKLILCFILFLESNKRMRPIAIYIGEGMLLQYIYILRESFRILSVLGLKGI